MKPRFRAEWVVVREELVCVLSILVSQAETDRDVVLQQICLGAKNNVLDWNSHHMGAT